MKKLVLSIVLLFSSITFNAQKLGIEPLATGLTDL